MSRVSTMGSSELEMNIRNNYSMVPSYSEALLMDCAGHNPNGNGYIPLHGAVIPHSGSYHNGYAPLPLHSPSETRTMMTTQNGHIVLENSHAISQDESQRTQSGTEISGYQMHSGVIQNPHAHTGYVVYENGRVHIQHNSALLPMGILPHEQREYSRSPPPGTRTRGNRLPSRHKRKKKKAKQQQQQQQHQQIQTQVDADSQMTTARARAGSQRSDDSHAHSDSDTVSHNTPVPEIRALTRSLTLTLPSSQPTSSQLNYSVQDDASLDIGSDVTENSVTRPEVQELMADDAEEDTSISLSFSFSEGREHYERPEVHTSSTILTEEIESLPDDSTGSPPDYEEALTMQIATSLGPMPIRALPTPPPAVLYNARVSEPSTSSLRRPLTIKCMETSLWDIIAISVATC